MAVGPIPEKLADKVMAAAATFVQHGLDGVTMSDIVEASGIPRATLYYHFDSKEAVFTFIYSRAFDEFEAAVASALEGSGSGHDRLVRVVRAQLEFYARQPMAREAVHWNPGRGARATEVVDRARTAYVGPLAKLIEDGIADGSFAPTSSPAAVAAAILGAVTTSAGLALQSGGENWLDDVQDSVTAFVLHGLAGRRPL